MKIILQKENILNPIKAIRGIVSQRGVQPVLSCILFETISNDRIRLTTTDLTLTMRYTVKADVQKEGKCAIDAKIIEGIVGKIPDKKNVVIDVDDETKNIVISAGETKYTISGLNADEFPNTDEVKKQDENVKELSFEISAKELNKAIKQTVFCALQSETIGVLSGASFIINENTLEMVATDGNRLARCRVPINSHGESTNFVCSHKTLNEIAKLISILPDDNVKFTVKGSKILFEFEDLVFTSSLISGNYPKYQQLIPENNEKVAVVNREELMASIDRIAVIVNERTSIMKFDFAESGLKISTNNTDAGSASENVAINYNSDELLIAFNYKYILDVLKCMNNENVRIEMSTELSATLVRPENEDDKEDDYLCLVMPVQIPRGETR